MKTFLTYLTLPTLFALIITFTLASTANARQLTAEKMASIASECDYLADEISYSRDNCINEALNNLFK